MVELNRGGLLKRTNIVSSFTDLKLAKSGQSTGKSVVRFAKSSRKCGLSECPQGLIGRRSDQSGKSADRVSYPETSTKAL